MKIQSTNNRKTMKPITLNHNTLSSSSSLLYDNDDNNSYNNDDHNDHHNQQLKQQQQQQQQQHYHNKQNLINLIDENVCLNIIDNDNNDDDDNNPEIHVNNDDHNYDCHKYNRNQNQQLQRSQHLTTKNNCINLNNDLIINHINQSNRNNNDDDHFNHQNVHHHHTFNSNNHKNDDDNNVCGTWKLFEWIKSYHIQILFVIYTIIMILLIYLISLVTKSFIIQTTNGQSTMVLLQVFGNGSVQIANITPISTNHQQQQQTSTTTTLSTTISQKQIEQERIMARERVKQNHLNLIREQLMQILLSGRTPPATNVTASSLNVDVVQIKNVLENGPPTPKMSIVNTNNEFKPSSSPLSLAPIQSSPSSPSSLINSEVYAQRLQSFYPTCDMSISDIIQTINNHQSSTTGERMEMKLYFELNIPKSPDSRTHITVMWAKLRLFIFDGLCDPLKNDGDDYSEMLAKCETNKLIISLYQYLPPLKRNRFANVRLVDRRTIPGYYRGHIDFNVQNVINDWQNQLPNYGLMINVENSNNQTLLSPFRFIHQMNCSDNVLPIPNLSELYGKNIMMNNTYDYRLRYPTLDVMTMEIAKDDDDDVNDQQQKLQQQHQQQDNQSTQQIASSESANHDHNHLSSTSAISNG